MVLGTEGIVWPWCALALAVLVTATAVWRHRSLRAGERAWASAHAAAPDGVIPGAESLALDGGERAVLLLHGFGDTPQSLAPQARALHARGWTVRVPLLPGHGRNLRAFRASDAAAWQRAAHESYKTLAAAHRRVAIVGQSMGGALAMLVAGEQVAHSPCALVLIVPYLHVSAKGRALTAIWQFWSIWRAWVPGNAEASIRDPAARARSLGYGCATPRLLRELRRVVDAAAALAGAVTTPTLAIFSEHDYRISPEVARRAYSRIGAPEKTIHWVSRSGHVISVDFDGEEVTRRVLDWLERHSVAATSHA